MAKAAAQRGGRLSKEELKHDTLVETAVKVESFYESHKQNVWIAGIAVVVLIVGIMGVSKWMGSGSKDESFALMKAKTSYGQQNLADAQAQFQAVQNSYGGAAAAEAQYYIARIKYDQGDYAGALAGFEACMKNYSPDAETQEGALAGWAAALEATGKDSEAAEKYDEIASKFASSAFAPEALTQAARLYLKLNQNDKALAALDKIIKNYPDSQSFQKARQQADQLR
jgi:TolA-binding protein